MNWKRSWTALLLCVVLVAADDSAPQVVNPEFPSWNKHGLGTTVVFEYTLDRQDFEQIKSEESNRLIRKSETECVIEVSVRSIAPAGQPPFKPYPRSVPAMTEAGREFLPDGFNGTYEFVGEETVMIAGRNYKCRIVQIEGTTQETRATGKVWISDEVPGLQVKGEMTAEADGQKLISKSILKSVSLK